MKKVLLLLLLFCGSIGFAQDKAEIKEKFWGAADPAKNIQAVPDKWKNESAVIMYKSYDYSFHKFGVRVTYITALRKRVKLQDQAAVKEFSEFSFMDRYYSKRGWTSNREALTVVGVKVIKPTGKETEINVDAEAVKVDKKKKIAIPNLEIGDIIDYYIYTVEPFKSIGAYGFETVETTIADEYPIMEMNLQLATENDFFINFATYNGAPALEKLPRDGDKLYRYQLVAKDVEKNDFPRWFYPMAELPCYKFQVYFARSGKWEDMASAFLPEKEDQLKSTVTADDIQKYYEGKFKAVGDLRDVRKYLKENTFASDAEKVKAVYYYTRHMYYTRYIEAFLVHEANLFYPFALYGVNPVYFNNEADFVNYYIAFLKDAKLDYDVLAATPRMNGPVKDLLLEDNLNLLIRVNTQPAVYLQFFTPFTNADQISSGLENTDAYRIKVNAPKNSYKIETIKLPTSTHEDNKSETVTNVTFNPEITVTNVERTSSLYGHNKDSEQRDRMELYDFVGEDYTKYGTQSIMELVSGEKARERYGKQFEALKDKIRQKHKEEQKTTIEEEFGFSIDSLSSEIKATGRFGAATPFTFTDKFMVKDALLKKAGANYIFEAGKLIGEQADLSKKELTRKEGIYMPYPRSYREKVVIDIPQGYTVSGIEKLNKKVENASGGFVSTATVQGNQLIITANKYYKNYYEPAANWGAITAFVEEAYQFTQEKILFKKM